MEQQEEVKEQQVDQKCFLFGYDSEQRAAWRLDQVARIARKEFATAWMLAKFSDGTTFPIAAMSVKDYELQMEVAKSVHKGNLWTGETLKGAKVAIIMKEDRTILMCIICDRSRSCSASWSALVATETDA